MAKIPSLKKVVAEDFAEDQQDIAKKIGYPFNTAIESITNALTGQLTFENMSWQYKELTIQVSADGGLGPDASFQTSIKKVLGAQVIFLSNVTNSSAVLTTAPFIEYAVTDNVIKINNITGLLANNKYIVRLIVYS